MNLLINGTAEYSNDRNADGNNLDEHVVRPMCYYQK